MLVNIPLLAVTLAVAEINPPVNKFAPVILPAALAVPPVVILLAVTVPDALNAPLTFAPLLITQVLLVLL